MIEFRANSGKNGSHRLVTLQLSTTLLSFYQTNDGDRWVQMIGDDAMLTARFRLPVPSAGGKSPQTLYGIADIIDSMQAENIRNRLSTQHNGNDYLETRYDEEMGIEFTADLSADNLKLRLCDRYGRQEERGASVDVMIALQDCPTPLGMALRNLPRAMQLDNQGIWPK